MSTFAFQSQGSTRTRNLLMFAAALLATWTLVVVHFAATNVIPLAPRPRGVQMLRNLMPQSTKPTNRMDDSEDDIQEEPDQDHLFEGQGEAIGQPLGKRKEADPKNAISSENDATVREGPEDANPMDSSKDESNDQDEVNYPKPDKIAEKDSVSMENDNRHPTKLDGFDNPNGLPKLPRLGPPSFFDILAPPYYGKSPVDDSRNYSPISGRRARAECDSIDSPFDAPARKTAGLDLPADVEQHISVSDGVAFIPAPTRLCSFGPTEYLDSRIDDNLLAAYEFNEVCLTMNIDSSKKVQRGLIYFDPVNHHPMRCVPCPNPIEMQRWGDHACGLMWNHQINAKSLEDYSKCYQDNKAFIGKISQRQVPGETSIKGGLLYLEPVLLLSFAHRNPGHQMFDSLFTLMPLLIRDDRKLSKVIVQQNPECPDTEWFCAILRRLGLLSDNGTRSIPMFQNYVPCFKSLVVPKWGLSRVAAYPESMLQAFRTKLVDAFNLRGDHADGKQKKRLLMYAHDTKSVEVKTHRRIWLRMRQEVAVDPRITSVFDVNVVDDFALMTVDEQAKAFNEADIVVMPHGGQFGNTMFSRSGTILIEIACNGYSHLGMTNGGLMLEGYIPRALSLIHVVVIPCECKSPGESDSDFEFGYEQVLAAVDLASPLSYGTHFAHNLVKDPLKPRRKCFE